MKKALVVTFGSVLAAGMMATASAHNLSERQFFGHTAVWVEGNYTQPSDNGVSVGDRFGGVSTVGARDGIRQPIFLDFGSNWDYALGFSYHIPHSHSRFFFNFDHFADGEDTSSDNVIGLNNAIALTGSASTVSAHGENRYREFKAGFMHTLNTSRRFHVDMSAFFAFDKLTRSIEEQLVDADGGAVVRHYRNTENKVEGWGPGLGVMARTSPFRCYPQIGFFAGGNTALIWADNDYQQYEIESSLGTDTLQYFWNPESSESVVGKLDISFGIDYARAIRTDVGGMMFDISLGMRYMNMFNAFKNGNTAANPLFVAGNLGGPENYAVNLGSPNDWGKMGPFIRFKVGGAHA